MTTNPPRPRAMREAVLDLLDQEQSLTDLQAVIAALHLIASGRNGIEAGEMIGLEILTRQARDLAETLRRSWRQALERVDDTAALDDASTEERWGADPGDA